MGAINQYTFNKHDRSKLEERSISYVNIPTFSLAIETLLDPTLKNRPIALASPFLKGARIAECSDEAKEQGVSKGMLLSQAELMCSDIKVIRPREELYQKVASQIEQDIQKLIPAFEREKKGKGFIDYTGFESVYGNPEDFHCELREKIEYRYCLRPDIGISCNKLVSKIAAKSLQHVSHQSIGLVTKGEAKEFLAPLPVEFLPIISEITKQQRLDRWDVLDDLNLVFVEDLQRLTKSHMEVAFGKMGATLHDFSLGIDPRPVVVVEEKPSLVFDVEFSPETNNCRLIFGTLNDLFDQGFRQLQNESKCADSCVVSLKYTTGEFKEINIKSKELISNKTQIHQELLRVMEKIGERRIAIKWIKLEFLNVQKLAEQLEMFFQANRSLDKKLNKIQSLYPGKILNFQEKCRLQKK